MARLIALEGIDGSGKGTQAQRLCDRLRAAGRRVALIGFPRYDATLFGAAIGRFLNGEFGALDQVHPFLAALLYAGDRFESRAHLRQMLEANDVVVCDRYVSSNVAHQGAKLEGAPREALIEAIEQIEHGLYELPRPDRVILLDIPVEQAQQLIARKSPRSYTDRAADLQEADAAYLQRVRDVYLVQAARDPSRWATVPCTAEGAVRSIDEIGAHIDQIVG